MITPHSLQKGDVLGIIAPAGMIADTALFDSGIRLLREMGFEVKFPRDLWPGVQYLADSDENRVNELHTFFRDSDVKGIVTMRGGFGCLRILNQLDVRLVAANPKWLIGFSDITVLQNHLYSQTGLITLHGPTLTALNNATPDTLRKFKQSFLGGWREPIEDKRIVQLQSGTTVTAPLVGGNLASLVTLLGTPYDFDWSDSIIFLEDINEPIYKIDRMLTQLSAAGKFDKVTGIILGDFSEQPAKDGLSAIRLKEQVWSRVLELCPTSNNIPIWGDFPAGHTSHNITFPLGATATMDCNRCELQFN